MGKFFDFIIGCILVTAVIFAWCKYFGIQTRVALLIGALIFVLFVVLFLLAKMVLGRRKKPNYNDIIFALSVAVNTKTAKLYANIKRISECYKEGTQYVLEEKEGIKILNVFDFKFGLTSDADIAAAYRQAISTGAIKVKVWSRGAGKGAREVAARLGLPLTFATKSEIKKYAVLHGLMPDLPKVKKRAINLQSAKDFISLVFYPPRAKYYIFSAAILIFTSFFTSLKIYYLVSAMVPAVLAIGCLIKKYIDG